ncbi:hypothetical protein R0137_16785 [Congregibacter brevis]|uniref:B box-type domain-containing protein n=1 Tax=Congregibacter brevis TaxID=3081201 RepID=A0ABZ0IBV4_9GAMM|nr:hypothetical protein R0137_16785 [Congregibacter sp. IMCC45268]
MNTCLNHTELKADFVCAVCGKYFCEECVGERFYPQPGFICHQCSGEQPADAPQPLPQHPKAEKRSTNNSAPRNAVLTASIEWAVIGLCIVIMLGLGAYRYSQPKWTPELLSDQPEDVATYCLSVLNVMEVEGEAPTLEEIAAVCPKPIKAEKVNSSILVTTPDSFAYGFSEIEVQFDPTTLTVTE